MVLSLAFILAFVGSAVALLIGIIIFSEVQGDMLQTFEVIQVGNTTGGITNSDVAYSCDSPVDGNNSIHTLDKTDGSLGADVVMVVSGMPTGISGCTGLAEDPITKTWYVVARESTQGSFGGYLAIINPVTGVGVSIGQIDDGLQSIAFDSSGKLYGFSNSQANNANHIFGIDKSTGLITSELCESNISDSQPQVIAYNYDTNKLVSFGITGVTDAFLEVFNDIDKGVGVSCDSTVGNIDFTDASHGGATFIGSPQSMTYNTPDDIFYAYVQAQNKFITITPSSPFVSLVIDDQTSLSHGDPHRGIGFELSNVAGAPIFERQVPDSFNQASNIAFTVVGILPVALFFALFAIFGGRTE